MDAMGRRRFLVLLAGAAGAGGVWWLKKPQQQPEATASAPPMRAEEATPNTTSGLPAADPTTSSSAAATSPSSTASTTNAPAPASTTTTTEPATTTTVTSTTTTAAASATPGALNGSTIEVIPRSAWGAVAAGSFSTHTIERVTYHHSAVEFSDNRIGPARFRSHQSFHQSLGWPDIAYHLLIDRQGNVFEGRPFDAVGDTGTDYDPTGHLLPLCEGNFDVHDPSAAQVEALAAVIGWARTQFGTDVVGRHRDYAGTSCPGDRLAARHDAIVAASDRYLGATLRLLSTDEGAARVATIEA